MKASVALIIAVWISTVLNGQSVNCNNCNNIDEVLIGHYSYYLTDSTSLIKFNNYCGIFKEYQNNQLKNKSKILGVIDTILFELRNTSIHIKDTCNDSCLYSIYFLNQYDRNTWNKRNEFKDDKIKLLERIKKRFKQNKKIGKIDENNFLKLVFYYTTCVYNKKIWYLYPSVQLSYITNYYLNNQELTDSSNFKSTDIIFSNWKYEPITNHVTYYYNYCIFKNLNHSINYNVYSLSNYENCVKAIAAISPLTLESKLSGTQYQFNNTKLSMQLHFIFNHLLNGGIVIEFEKSS